MSSLVKREQILKVSWRLHDMGEHYLFHIEVSGVLPNIHINSVTPSGMSLQSMDNGHVALVTLNLDKDGFQYYNCDKSSSLGVKIDTLSKIMKISGPKDSVSLKVGKDQDTMTIIFQDATSNQFSKFSLNLMNIERDTLGIPGNVTNYINVVH